MPSTRQHLTDGPNTNGGDGNSNDNNNHLRATASHRQAVRTLRPPTPGLTLASTASITTTATIASARPMRQHHTSNAAANPSTIRAAPRRAPGPTGTSTARSAGISRRAGVTRAETDIILQDADADVDVPSTDELGREEEMHETHDLETHGAVTADADVDAEVQPQPPQPEPRPRRRRPMAAAVAGAAAAVAVTARRRLAAQTSGSPENSGANIIGRQQQQQQQQQQQAGRRVVLGSLNEAIPADAKGDTGCTEAAETLEFVNRQPDGSYLLGLVEPSAIPGSSVANFWQRETAVVREGEGEGNGDDEEEMEAARIVELDQHYATTARQYFTSGGAIGGRGSRRLDERKRLGVEVGMSQSLTVIEADSIRGQMVLRLREQVLLRLEEERWQYEPVDRMADAFCVT